MEGYQVYSDKEVESLVNLYLDGAERDKLDPILDFCVVAYKGLEVTKNIALISWCNPLSGDPPKTVNTLNGSI